MAIVVSGWLTEALLHLSIETGYHARKHTKLLQSGRGDLCLVCTTRPGLMVNDEGMKLCPGCVTAPFPALLTYTQSRQCHRIESTTNCNPFSLLVACAARPLSHIPTLSFRLPAGACLRRYILRIALQNSSCLIAAYGVYILPTLGNIPLPAMWMCNEREKGQGLLILLS